MEELEKARKQLNMVRLGEMKANEACDMVNSWLMLSVYDLAYSVASNKSKKSRQEAMQKIKDCMPEFYDDVKTMAVKIYDNNR